MTREEIIGEILAAQAEQNAAVKKAYVAYSERLKVIQEKCGKVGHDWKWHQIAGEGRYCKICGFDDPNTD